MATVQLPAMPGLAVSYLSGLRPRHGDSLPDTTLTVHQVRVADAHLAAYQRVCGFDRSDVLPASYPHVLAFPLAMRLMGDRAFPFALPGLVHVANEIAVHRPIRATEPITLAVHAERLAAHHSGRTIDLVATATIDDEPVWSGRSRYLRRGTPHPEVPRESRPAPVPPSVWWTLPRELGRRYASISGDRNPIHLSRLTARPFGYRRPIAHGMWTAAACLAALAPRLPDTYTADVSFARPVRLGSRVGFGATPTPDGWTCTLTDRAGTPLLTAHTDHP